MIQKNDFSVSLWRKSTKLQTKPVGNALVPSCCWLFDTFSIVLPGRASIPPWAESCYSKVSYSSFQIKTNGNNGRCSPPKLSVFPPHSSKVLNFSLLLCRFVTIQGYTLFYYKHERDFRQVWPVRNILALFITVFKQQYQYVFHFVWNLLSINLLTRNQGLPAFEVVPLGYAPAQVAAFSFPVGCTR